MRQLYSTEAEQNVIGSILKLNHLFDEISAIIGPDDFYHQEFAAIFANMCEFKNFEPVSLSAALGGDSFKILADLLNNTVLQSHGVRYAQVVRERSIERELFKFSSEMQDILLSGEGNHEQMLAEIQSGFTSLQSEQPADTQVGIKDAVKNYIEWMDWRYNNPGIHGVTYGLSAVDERMKGLKPGNLIILAANSGMGKTTLALNTLAYAAPVDGSGSAMMFSLEMPTQELTQRLFASVGLIPMGQLSDASALKTEHSSKMMPTAKNLAEKNIVFDDDGAITMQQLASRAKIQHRKCPLKLLMVDYLQLVRVPGAKSEYEAVSKVSMGLKALAKELGCPVVALSQLNRENQKRADSEPKPSDLRSSGQIEQDADIIQFLHYEGGKDDPWPRVVKLITAKFRNGVVGSDLIMFDGRINRFYDLTPEAYRDYSEAKKEKQTPKHGFY